MRTLTIVLRDREAGRFLARDLRWVEVHVNELVQRMFDITVESITVKEDGRTVLEHVAEP